MGTRGALGSVFSGGLQCSGICGVQGSLVLRALCCLGFAVLEGVCSSGVRVAPGSGFCLLPISIFESPLPPSCWSPRPLPRRCLQLPFPSFRRSRPSQRCHLPAGSSPALILDPSSPCSSRTCCSQPSMSRFPPRSPAPPPFPPDPPLPGICPSCPHGRGQDSVLGDAATAVSAPARGDKDTNPRAGRRSSRWNEGGNRDRTRGLMAPAWFVVTVL